MEVVSSVFCRISLVFNLADGVKPSPWEKRKSCSQQKHCQDIVDVCMWSGSGSGLFPVGQRQKGTHTEKFPINKYLFIVHLLHANYFLLICIYLYFNFKRQHVNASTTST